MQHPPRNIVIDWLNTLWATSLESNSKLIACNLRRYMNSHNDMAWPSVSRIANECGLSQQCVRKHLKILQAEGWLVKQGRSGLETNIYQASYPPAIIAPLQSTSLTPATIAPELNKELNKNIQRGFIPPSVDEVKKYCQDRGNNIDPEYFVDQNTQKGWMVGKQKMKDWKAAVRTWEKNEVIRNGASRQGNEQGRKLSGAERTRRAREAARLRRQSPDLGRMATD